MASKDTSGKAAAEPPPYDPRQYQNPHPDDRDKDGTGKTKTSTKTNTKCVLYSWSLERDLGPSQGTI